MTGWTKYQLAQHKADQRQKARLDLGQRISDGREIGFAEGFVNGFTQEYVECFAMRHATPNTEAYAKALAACKIEAQAKAAFCMIKYGISRDVVYMSLKITEAQLTELLATPI